MTAGSAWSFTAGCLKCGGELEVVTVGKTTGFQTSAVLVCEPCKTEWQVLVMLRPVVDKAAAWQGVLEPCGTEAAYVRHRRAGEDPCPACKDAHAANRRAVRTLRASA